MTNLEQPYIPVDRFPLGTAPNRCLPFDGMKSNDCITFAPRSVCPARIPAPSQTEGKKKATPMRPQPTFTEGQADAYLFVRLDEQNTRSQPRHRPITTRAPQGVFQLEPQTGHHINHSLPQILALLPNPSGESQRYPTIRYANKSTPASSSGLRRAFLCVKFFRGRSCEG